MKINKGDIVCLLLFLVGLFCQISQLMSRNIMILYLSFCFFLFLLSVDLKHLKVKIGFVWFFVFVFFCIFSLIYTINIINSNYVYIRLLTYLFLVFLTSPFLEKKENIQSMIKGFIVGGLFGIVIVLSKQYNFIGIKRLGANIYGSYAEFGNVCMMTLSSFIFLKDKLIKNKIIIIAVMVFIILGILLSGARKAMIVPILMLLFLQLFDRRKHLSKKIMMLLVVLSFAIIVVYMSLNNKTLYNVIGYRIESGISSVFGSDKNDASLSERSYYKKMAKDMFMEKPVFGWGIHAFAYRNYLGYGKAVYCHDGFLEILSSYGIVGFILFYWFCLYVFMNCKKLLYDDIGIFLFSYIVIILLMEPYSISFLNSNYILIICSCLNLISQKGGYLEENN